MEKIREIIQKIEEDARKKKIDGGQDFILFVIGHCRHREFRPEIGITKEDIPTIAEWAKKRAATWIGH